MDLTPILLTLVLAAPSGAPASSIPVKPPAAAASHGTLSPNRIVTRVPPSPKLTVGDRFSVDYVVTTPHPSLVTGPLADSLGPFVIAEEKRNTTRRGDVDETTYRLGIACFAPGRHTLPRLRFTVSFGERGDTLSGDTLAVAITSVLPDSMKDVHGLKPAETFPNYWLWLIPAAILLAVALFLLGRKLYRKLKRLDEGGPPPLPAWEEALGSLDRLPWREWLAEGQFKRFYYALSEILKRYLERRFEFDAVEQTTTELLASMRAHKLPMRDEITRFFARVDLVKYAKTVPPSEEAEQAIEQLRDFVVRTKPAPPAAPAANGQVVPASGGA